MCSISTFIVVFLLLHSVRDYSPFPIYIQLLIIFFIEDGSFDGGGRDN